MAISARGWFAAAATGADTGSAFVGAPTADGTEGADGASGLEAPRARGAFFFGVAALVAGFRVAPGCAPLRTAFFFFFGAGFRDLGAAFAGPRAVRLAGLDFADREGLELMECRKPMNTRSQSRDDAAGRPPKEPPEAAIHRRETGESIQAGASGGRQVGTANIRPRWPRRLPGRAAGGILNPGAGIGNQQTRDRSERR